MSKQRRLTAWLKPWEGEPPAKCDRQDTESNAEAASDPSATLDSALLSSSSDAPTRSCFDPGRSLSSGSHIARSRLESFSKPYDIGRMSFLNSKLLRFARKGDTPLPHPPLAACKRPLLVTLGPPQIMF